MTGATVARGGYAGRGLHGVMVEHLGRRIVAGRPAPGETLPREPQLADEYDVSRTVVREALKVLAAKGLVDARPMRGTQVRPRSQWRMLDPDLMRWALETDASESLLGHLLQLRLVLEPSAAGLAADHASHGAAAELERCLGDLSDQRDRTEAFIEADLAFHAAVLDAAGNPLLSELFAPIEAAMRMSRRVQARGVERSADAVARSVDAHRLVVETVLADDAQAAESAMRAVVQAAIADAERAIGSRLWDGSTA